MLRTQFRLKIIWFLSIILILNSCLILLGWHLHHFQLIHSFHLLAPMPYITAISFILIALSLIFSFYFQRIALLVASILIIVSGVKLIEYIIYVNLGISELIIPHYFTNQLYALGKMSPNSALCFLLASIIIILCHIYHNRNYLKICAFSFSILIAFLSIMPTASHLTGTEVLYGSNGNISNVLILSISFMVLSISFLLKIWPGYRNIFNQKNNVSTISTLIIGSIVFLLLWQMSTAYSYKSIKMSTYQEAKSIASNTSSTFHTYYLGAESFLADSQNESTMNNSYQWQQQAKKILQNFPAAVSLSKQIDHHPIIIQRDNNDHKMIQVINKQCQQQLGKDTGTKNALNSHVILSQKTAYFCIGNRSLQQTMIINLSTILERSIQPYVDKEQNVMVSYHNISVYQSKHSKHDDKFIDQWQARIPIILFDQRLMLYHWPSQRYIITHNLWLPEILVAIGLIITFLLAFSFYLLEVVKTYNQSLVTKVKKQSQDLRSSEIRYHFLYENLPDMYASISNNGKIMNCNKTLADKLGYHHSDDLLKKNIISLHHPADRKTIIAAMRQLQQKNKVDNIELKLKKHNGEYLPVILKAHGVDDQQTGTMHWMLRWQDISEQRALESDITRLKTTELALSKKVLELDLIYQATSMASESTDLQETLAFCLKLICQLSQWPAGHAYLVNEKANRLESSKIWGSNQYHISGELKKLSEKTSFAQGEGLPGHIWRTKKATWVESIQQDDQSIIWKEKYYQASDATWIEHDYEKNQFPRLALLEKLGIRGAIGFPVIFYGKVIAVLEFLSYFPEKEDEDLLRIFQILGEQLGHVLERRNNEEKLQKLAHFDNLTQLPNRNYFQNELQMMLARAERNHNMIAILFIDLDHFKHINDSMGHHYGDLLLQKVAAHIKKSARKSDFVARIGGDEFVVITDTICSKEEVVTIAERILTSCQHPEITGDSQINVSLSIGIAIYPTAGKTAEEILRFADTAMYQAKSYGRNNYQFFTEEINKSYLRNIMIEQELKKAIKNEEFSMCYQPIIDSNNHNIYALEALIRWHNPILKNVTPDEFIPIAEHYNLIFDIGKWTFDQACQQLALIHQQPLMKDIKISVNCSPAQFRQQDFIKQITHISQQYKLDANNIILEVTETMLMSQMEQAILTLTQLHEAGFQIAIDDFGTGYSSLNYLKKLPISSLKIDRSFIIDIDEKNDAIMHAIIQMAKTLHLNIIAEGIETKQQLDTVNACGCHLIQGFYFAKPMTMETCQKFIINYLAKPPST